MESRACQKRNGERTVDNDTNVRVGEIESNAKDALMEEFNDRNTDAILSVNTVEETSTSCDRCSKDL